MIDVGGAALLGAAARNYAGVAAVADPRHYPRIVRELRERGAISAELRQQLAAEAFGIVAAYHAEIAAYINQVSGTTFPNRLAMVLEKVEDLRYGENPHQRAAFYRETTHRSGTLADATPAPGRPAQLQQPPRPRRRLPDRPRLHRADGRHRQAHRPGRDRLERRARRGLPEGPRDRPGRGLRRDRRRSTASSTARRPGRSRPTRTRPWSPPASARPRSGILRAKTGLELLAVPPDPSEGLRDYGIANLDFKRVAGGLLVETQDALGLEAGQLQVVTKRRPTLEELTDLLFAWRTVRHVRSNAIVLARNAATVGIGAAQASRQVAVEIALRRAGDRARMSVMASDAYFPFPDGIALAANSGVTAIIQPGGSIRDEMAIEVADRHHLAMVFTGRRHFRH